MARRTKTQEKEIEFATGSVNEPKRELIAIMGTLENAGLNAQADKLGRIIGRLERWQHTAANKRKPI